MMTAINAEGYGVIYLTPDHMVDFSEGEAVIQFDLSTARKSPRDWQKGVVQFGHHSYNPTKGCDTCEPNTWHWGAGWHVRDISIWALDE